MQNTQVTLTNNERAVLDAVEARWRISRQSTARGDTRYRNRFGVFAYFSDEQLAAKTGLNRTTIIRIRKKLVEAGCIRVVSTGRGLQYYVQKPLRQQKFSPASAQHQMLQNATSDVAKCDTSIKKNISPKRKASDSLLRGAQVSPADYDGAQEGEYHV